MAPENIFHNDGSLTTFESIHSKLQLRRTWRSSFLVGKDPPKDRSDLSNNIDDNWFLEGSTAVGLIEIDQRILFFYRELVNGREVSRIGSVCKDDTGGKSDENNGKLWSSFITADFACPINNFTNLPRLVQERLPFITSFIKNYKKKLRENGFFHI